MRRSAVILAASAAALLGPLGAAAPASAGSYTTQLCHNLQPNPPGAGGGWSTQVAGSAISSNANPAAWIDACSHYRNNVGNWQGLGGAFGDTAAPGSYAFAMFTPPAGSTISYVRAFEDLVITSGAYAEAGIFAASTGRSLTDNSAYLNGDGVSTRSTGSFDANYLGADGAQGVLFGGRCPASLPPLAGGYCGGAGASFANLEITIDDPSRPTADASIALDAMGRATLSWSASDAQSGITDVVITRSGAGPVTQPSTCNVAAAPSCPPSVSGSTSVQLAEGETATYSVTANSVGGSIGQPVTKTVSVTRPQSPAPTTPPTIPTTQPTTPPSMTPSPTTPPAAAKVSFKTKAVKGGRVKLSGTARGCKRVSVSVPGRKHRSSASVKRGKWSVTVTRKRGTYRAKCGTVTAKRTVR